MEAHWAEGVEVDVPGFSGLFKARAQHRGAAPSSKGGVATFVRQGLAHCRLDDLRLPPGAALEALAVEVRPEGAPP